MKNREKYFVRINKIGKRFCFTKSTTDFRNVNTTEKSTNDRGKRIGESTSNLKKNSEKSAIDINEVSQNRNTIPRRR